MARSMNPNASIMRIVLWNIVVVIALLIIGEIIARMTISYNPSYYTSIDAKNRDVVFPYGTIRFNSLGHPDDEFDLSDPRPRLAYVGDSVTMGVGAGYGYRFSDLLKDTLPGYQHMTLASINEGFRTKARMRRLTKTAHELGVQQVFYVYNLNDTLPSRAESADGGSAESVDEPFLIAALNFVKNNTEFLRSSSYLFNWARFKFRIALLRFGIDGHSGLPTFEMFPDQNIDVFEDVADRIIYLRDLLEDQSINLILVILPYEMQISEEAEKTYRELGIQWGETFVQRRPQEILIELLSDELPVIDLYEAFVPKASEREEIGVGEFFVFNEGDSLDWNHPNRAGHARIATFMAENAIFRAALSNEQVISGK